MNALIFGKRVLSSTLCSVGIPERKLRGAARDGLLILMYHRVVDGGIGRGMGHDGLYVEPETFEKQLLFLKRHFLVVPLLEGFDFLERRRGGGTPGHMPMCAITFDDGWQDVYENAFPLLQSHGITATVFLPTGFIGTRNQFWTDRLARILNARSHVKARGDLRSSAINAFRKAGFPEMATGMELYGIVEVLKQRRHEEIEEILHALDEECGPEFPPEGRSFLNWEEVGEMFRSGLVRFGSHTESHRILTTLADDEVALELRRSKERLVDAGVVDPASIPFAYPNGNHNDRIATMVHDAGYRIAVTTESGWNRMEPVPQPCRLKRIGIHQDIASTDAMFCCRLAEIY